jgi:uncharacterized protein involved in outer membrane biogenesis
MITAPCQPQVKRRCLGRRLLAWCLGVAGLLMLGLVLLPDIVALKQVQRVLVSRVEAALPRRVTVGAVRVQRFTGLAVTLEDITLDTPPGWAHPHGLRIGTLSLQVAPRALLQRPVAITKVVVRDAELVIERDPHGRLNLGDLTVFRPGPAQGPGLHRYQASPAAATHWGGKFLARWPMADVM